MKLLIRIWYSSWFLSRIIFYCEADFSKQYEVYVWDEVFWFLLWISSYYVNELLRYLLLISNLSTKTIVTCRSELFKFGLIFVSLILWEIINCINYRLAQSAWVQTVMLGIAGILITWIIKDTKE